MNIYLSPSVQDWNKGAGNYGTEEQRMNQLADIVEPLLKLNGFTVYRNNRNMTLEEIVKDSNSKIGPDDIHVALHSNAGKAFGTEIWHFSGSAAGKKLAESIYNQVAPFTPNPDRGVKNNRVFRELNGTEGIAVILETIFHDNASEAKWMTENMAGVAVAVVKGICDYAGKEYHPKSPRDQFIFRVDGKRVGKYGFDNVGLFADKYKSQAKKIEIEREG